MAFFKKLKDKLFKSSSKLDEGLEAIVEDGGVEEQVELPVAEPAPTPGPAPIAAAPDPEEVTQVETSDPLVLTPTDTVGEVDRAPEPQRS